MRLCSYCNGRTKSAYMMMMIYGRDVRSQDMVSVSGVRSRSRTICLGLVTYGLVSRGLSRPFLNLGKFKMTSLLWIILILFITLLITFNFEIKP